MAPKIGERSEPGRIQLKKTEIPSTIEVRFQGPIDKESGIRYLESGIHSVESRRHSWIALHGVSRRRLRKL